MRYEKVTVEIKGLDRCSYTSWDKIITVIKVYISGYEVDTR